MLLCAFRRPSPAWVALFLLFAALFGAGAGREEGGGRLRLHAAGLLGDSAGAVVPLPPGLTGASYLPGSDVLRLSDGRLRYVPPGGSGPVTVPPDDPGALAAVARTRAWLRSGRVPGSNDAERDIAARSLLNIRLLVLPGGAAVAAARDSWDYVWPRDASWMAAALAATGHHEESREILGFLARVQRPDGTWEARYHPGGSPVLDGRAPQLDANGWFLWALWVHAQTGNRWEDARALWPAARRAADAAAGSLGPDGLPPPGADYWERRTLYPNLGTAAPLRAGLRAAWDTARRLGHRREARRYARAAVRLDAAIRARFAPLGYPRTTASGSGADAAVNFLAPPFAPHKEGVERAVRGAAGRLLAPNGGAVPGERWPAGRRVAWTPATALFMLSAAASGRGRAADRWLGWLAAHRTQLGAFPEKVGPAGRPGSAAPLGWTEAIVVLALAAEEGRVPVPPVPGD
ncbi:hypothetical protein Rxycam_01229 [Rubrobacter xylanophilus DSM 9941]|nr:hypothetical protein Rxycam_01229 [Rubrobacter xylanophilus DSM 9941]